MAHEIPVDKKFQSSEVGQSVQQSKHHEYGNEDVHDSLKTANSVN